MAEPLHLNPRNTRSSTGPEDKALNIIVNFVIWIGLVMWDGRVLEIDCPDMDIGRMAVDYVGQVVFEQPE